MGALVAFLFGPVGRWILVALAVTALVVGGYHKVKRIGWNERDTIAIAEENARRRESDRVLAAERAKLESYNRELDARIAAERARVAELELKLKRLFAQMKKEVKTYVTKESDARIAACGGIPLGFVVLHDRAARGDPGEAEVPAPAGSGGLERDSGVALSEVADATVDNYGKFHRCMTALKAWEAWYPAVKEIYERNTQ